MNGSNGFRLSPRLIIGVAILLLGVLWTLDNMDYIESEQYTQYWPVVLIAIGLAKLTDTGSSKVGPVMLMTVGAFILVVNVTDIRWRVTDLIPLCIALFGAKLVWDAVGRRRAVTGGGDRNSVVHSFAMMAGSHHQSTSQSFSRGDVNAIMGGVELDLRNAKINDGEEAVLDAFAMWGGIEITVPENWRIVGQVTPLLGGFENKTRAAGSSGPVLIVKGTAVMGAVEVKN